MRATLIENVAPWVREKLTVEDLPVRLTGTIWGKLCLGGTRIHTWTTMHGGITFVDPAKLKAPHPAPHGLENRGGPGNPQHDMTCSNTVNVRFSSGILCPRWAEWRACLPNRDHLKGE